MLPRTLTLLACLAAASSRPAMAQAPSDGQWTMPGKDYASTRYSGLAQITPANARAAPGLDLLDRCPRRARGPATRGEQHHVRGDTLPERPLRLRSHQGGLSLRWKYRPDVSPKAIGIACCDAVNRGAFYADGKIVYNLLDGHTVAVDAETGRELGRRKSPTSSTARPRHGAAGGEESRDRRPLGRRVRHPRLVQGPRPRDRQDRLDRAQPRPRRRMLASAGTFKPFYDKGPELGTTTWADDTWKRAVRRSGAGFRTTPSST